MSFFDEEYYCPNCNATLNDQDGFDPDLGVWTCTECGKCLYGSDIEKTQVEFNGVVWYCDSCGAVLSLQDGFSDDCGSWECTVCGATNNISEDEIYESEADYQEKSTLSSVSDILNIANSLLRTYGESRGVCFDGDDEGDDDDDDSDESEDSSTCSVDFHSSHFRAPQSETSRATSTRQKESHRKTKLILTAIIMVALVFAVGYYEISKLIPVQYSSSTLIGNPYETVIENLKKAGFAYVSTNEISDLNIQDYFTENRVTDIKIGWFTSFDKETKLPSNFPVIITYHTLKKIVVPMSSKDAKGSDYKEMWLSL